MPSVPKPPDRQSVPAFLNIIDRAGSTNRLSGPNPPIDIPGNRPDDAGVVGVVQPKVQLLAIWLQDPLGALRTGHPQRPRLANGAG
jgi:hypothetical protein